MAEAVNLETKPRVEQVRLRGRNTHDVMNQVVTEYNSSNGWALVRVVPNLLNIEVILERSTAQATDSAEVEIVKAQAPQKEAEPQKTDVLDEKKATVAKPSTRAKKETVKA